MNTNTPKFTRGSGVRAAPEPASISRLRGRVFAEQVPSITQLRRLRDEIRKGSSLQRCARRVGLDERQVLSTVADLGRWAMQSIKQDPPPLVEADKRTPPGASGEALGVDPRQLSMFDPPSGTGQDKSLPTEGGEGDAVLVPGGFIEAAGTAIEKPLATLIGFDIDDEMIDRWVARTYTASLPMLTFPVIAAVWRMATLDKLELLESVSQSPRFTKVVLEAYDLLEQSRSQALESMGQLIGPLRQVRGDQLDQDGRQELSRKVQAACTRASWLREQELMRVARAAKMLPEEPRTAPHLATALAHLRRIEQVSPSATRTGSIADLSEGQMVRISQLAGVPTDPPDPKQAVDIRRRIREMQLGRDSDQLVPNALIASQAGKLDRYLGILEMRTSGDTTWLDEMLLLAAEPRQST